VDTIGYEFQPVGAGGAVNVNAMLSVVDESAALQGTASIDDPVERLSSYRNVHLHSQYGRLVRKLDLV
jgi:hypothetical protein